MLLALDFRADDGATTALPAEGHAGAATGTDFTEVAAGRDGGVQSTPATDLVVGSGRGDHSCWPLPEPTTAIGVVNAEVPSAPSTAMAAIRPRRPPIQTLWPFPDTASSPVNTEH